MSRSPSSSNPADLGKKARRCALTAIRSALVWPLPNVPRSWARWSAREVYRWSFRFWIGFEFDIYPATYFLGKLENLMLGCYFLFSYFKCNGLLGLYILVHSLFFFFDNSLFIFKCKAIKMLVLLSPFFDHDINLHIFCYLTIFCGIGNCSCLVELIFYFYFLFFSSQMWVLSWG